jgi:hypothetical protein
MLREDAKSPSCNPEVEPSRWWIVTRIFLVAVLLNFPWERAQSILYLMKDGTPIPWWQCLVMSLGDGLLILLIFWIGGAFFRRPAWFEHPGVRGYLLMFLTGLVIIIPLEGAMIYGVEWWRYTARMPLVPGLGVGLSPVAQMLVLPPLVFRVVALWVGKSQP